MQRLTWVVFGVSLAILGWRAGAAGIATAYVDPVARIQAQDEAVYGSTSFAMATHGDWLTPRFLDRYALYKPPLLYWLSAAAVQVSGQTAGALRLPPLLAGAATVALVFWWLIAENAPLATALAGALLLLSSHLFFVLSRVGLTDALLTFEITAAMCALARDPRLSSRAAVCTFGCASGAAIMTKGLAGLMPLLILGLVCVVSRERPAWPRLARVAALALLVAAPWHLYQLSAHPRWFWAEYVLTEQGVWGFGSPAQTTQESQAGFYLKRLVFLDPVLLAAAVAGLVRRRARVPLAALAVVFAAVLVFQYRNAAYLMPALPALAFLAAGAIPPRFAMAALAVAASLFAGKAAFPTQTWGLPYAPESVNPSHAPLDRYAALHRQHPLILIQPEDQFYSADLDLPRVRYVYLDPGVPRPRLPLDFEYLGVVMTAADFARLDQLRPVFEQRLREWNLDSGDPIATTILARQEDEIAALIQAHPESDFFTPPGWAARDQGVHDVLRFTLRSGPQPASAREFLLSREVVQRP